VVTSTGASPDTAPIVLFWIFASLAVLGALATITRRNPVVAVVCLVGTFFALAVDFLLLYAQFLAVIQVMVYAGAIMVLFVFVVMVVSRAESEPLWRVTGPVTKVLGLGAIVYLVVRGWTALAGYRPTHVAPPSGDFGTTSGVGRVLLGDFLFPFEAISILLLVAVVGALVVARQHHDKAKDQWAEHAASPGGQGGHPL
jgi:NADH-quinone oxidoreductase subunit J